MQPNELLEKEKVCVMSACNLYLENVIGTDQFITILNSIKITIDKGKNNGKAKNV